MYCDYCFNCSVLLLKIVYMTIIIVKLFITFTCNGDLAEFVTDRLERWNPIRPGAQWCVARVVNTNQERH